jgi:hypothetical protein
LHLPVGGGHVALTVIGLRLPRLDLPDPCARDDGEGRRGHAVWAQGKKERAVWVSGWGVCARNCRSLPGWNTGSPRWLKNTVEEIATLWRKG